MVEFSYIHIPFCSKKCKYCSFVSFINLNLIDKYVDCLLFEIEKEYDASPQKTLYFGGGTPSLLTVEQTKKIKDKFIFQKNPEITFEINPENASIDYLRGLFDIGINRLSVGIQTFNDKLLSETGRRHSSKEALTTIENAQKIGFKNISIDLIYGLNNQTVKDFEKDLNIANSLNISHISTYGLKIEDGTYYHKFTPDNLPDDETQAEMYKLAIKKLTNFNLYEISNFAKSNAFKSRHNLCYWNLSPYNGFGISASGFDGKTRYKNTSSFKEYLENPLKKEEVIKLTKDNLLEETIFLGFRKQEGINIEQINQNFNIDFEKKYKNILNKYIKSKHIEKTKQGYRLTINGILISNYILCDFLMI